VVPDYDDFLRSRNRPVLLLDPVVLDGTAQLLGAMLFDRGVHILPVAVEQIELYRPAPPPGTRVPARLEVTECNYEERRVRAIVEVQDGSGNVWFRIAGLQELIFRYSKRLLHTQREPARHTLSEENSLPGLPVGAVATLLPRALLRDVRPDDLARIFLHDSEWSVFEAAGQNRSQQREWLMGRIAAKDAVRLWLGRRNRGPMPHPTQLVIENDPAGRPIVRGREGQGNLPAISIAHKADVAAAVATEGPIGIDVEPTDAGERLRLEDVATAREIDRLQRTAGGDDPAWLTRLWCGKEAAAKALGTGLQGRPRAFEAVELAADGRLVVENGEPRRRVRVLTSQANGWTFAVASIPPNH
jgi:phosphopantetheinyl transferase